MNSMGMKNRRKWKMIFSTGHSEVFISLHARGERTRVSHAATVSVQTKKYLCALRWGGKLREGGRSDVISAIASVFFAVPLHNKTKKLYRQCVENGREEGGVGFATRRERGTQTKREEEGRGALLDLVGLRLLERCMDLLFILVRTSRVRQPFLSVI